MDFNNLLGHNLDKFGMVTVLDVTIYSIAGEPLLELDTLKVSSISSEGSQKEIRGGQGAELLLQYDYGRTATVAITDALASMDSLEYLWGGSLTEGNITYAGKVNGVCTEAAPEITLTSAAGNASISSATGPVTFFNFTQDTKQDLTAVASAVTLTGAVTGDRYALYYEAEDAGKELTLSAT